MAVLALRRAKEGVYLPHNTANTESTDSARDSPSCRRHLGGLYV
jgi:hypothetical protein